MAIVPDQAGADKIQFFFGRSPVVGMTVTCDCSLGL